MLQSSSRFAGLFSLLLLSVALNTVGGTRTEWHRFGFDRSEDEKLTDGSWAFRIQTQHTRKKDKWYDNTDASIMCLTSEKRKELKSSTLRKKVRRQSDSHEKDNAVLLEDCERYKAWGIDNPRSLLWVYDEDTGKIRSVGNKTACLNFEEGWLTLEGCNEPTVCNDWDNSITYGHPSTPLFVQKHTNRFS